MEKLHVPVLYQQVLSLFSDQKIHTFVDGTLGAGGHAKLILEAHPEIELYIGIDQDISALEIAKRNLDPWKDKIQYIHSNYYDAIKGLINCNVDGILLDLGVSSMQLDRAERGFSFMRDGPLDMRMNPQAPLTAKIIVNEWSSYEIGKILRDYGEEKQWKRATQAIVEARKINPIETTQQLVSILSPLIYRKKGKKINPLTLIFQGLRIAVNNELEVVEKTLPLCIDLLNPGGKLAVISFHSLEDRIAKKTFEYYSSDKENTSGMWGTFKDKKPIIKKTTRKPLIADEKEIEANPRSSCAKLRCIEKL